MLQNGLKRKHKLILFFSMDSRYYQTSFFTHLLNSLTNGRTGVFLSLLRVLRTCFRSMEYFETVWRVLQNMF